MATKRKTELDIDPSLELPGLELDEVAKKEESAAQPPPPKPEPAVTAKAAPEPVEKKGSKRTIYIVAGLLSAVVLAGGVSLAVFFGADEKPPVPKIEKVVEKKPAPKLVSNMDLDPFILPIDQIDGKNFLRIKFSLSLSSEDAVAEVEENLPSMRETIYRFTKQREIDEFMSPDIKHNTMLELGRLLDRKLQSGRVKEVHITEVAVF